jgi:hypothetical protein
MCGYKRDEAKFEAGKPTGKEADFWSRLIRLFNQTMQKK